MIIIKEFNYDKSVTSRDVAKLAGVSQSTVSRVFNNNSEAKVKPEARAKVLEAAKKLGYRPNFIARGMVSGKSNIVGIVVGEGMGPFYNRIINLLVTKLQDSGKQPLMFKINKRENINNIVLKVLQFQVDSLIITAPAIKKDIKEFSIKTDIPIVLFNRLVENINLNMVFTDSYYGAELAAKYLCDSGHKRIGYIGYLVETYEEQLKLNSFSKTLRDYGLYLNFIEKAEYSYPSGYNAMTRGLENCREEYPTAIFCTSDLMAIGAIDASKDKFGLKVPEDISIIGYDDIEMSRWTSYNLTTIRQPYDYLVDETIKLIEIKEKDKDTKKTRILKRVEPQLIVRDSVLSKNSF